MLLLPPLLERLGKGSGNSAWWRASGAPGAAVQNFSRFSWFCALLPSAFSTVPRELIGDIFIRTGAADPEENGLKQGFLIEKQ